MTYRVPGLLLAFFIRVITLQVPVKLSDVTVAGSAAIPTDPVARNERPKISFVEFAGSVILYKSEPLTEVFSATTTFWSIGYSATI